MDRPSFEQLIKEDRAARESKTWRGTFLEYLDLVRDDPSLPRLAHARVYDTLMRAWFERRFTIGRLFAVAR